MVTAEQIIEYLKQRQQKHQKKRHYSTGTKQQEQYYTAQHIEISDILKSIR